MLKRPAFNQSHQVSVFALSRRRRQRTRGAGLRRDALEKIFGLFAVVAIVVVANPAYSQKKITGWSISCGVDKGAMKKTGNSYLFRPSSNKCDGDTPWGWKQRTEISSKQYKPTLRGTYLFETTLALKSSSTQRFDVFQMHDGRQACAPPLKVEWSANNRLSLVGGYKVQGKGEDYCLENNITTKNVQNAPLRRDGREYLFQVLITFDGSGAFIVSVSIDGNKAVEGRYGPNLRLKNARSVTGIKMNAPVFEMPKKYYFKHGVYSQKAFNFELRSDDLSMQRVKR